MKKLIYTIAFIFLFTGLPVKAETVRVLYHASGAISVIHPAPKSKLPSETEGEWLKRVLDEARPNGVNYKDMDSSQLPSRDNRSEWRGTKTGEFYFK